jgi:hypothetical protein
MWPLQLSPGQHVTIPKDLPCVVYGPSSGQNDEGRPEGGLAKLERVMRIELTTSSLATKCSTAELHPLGAPFPWEGRNFSPPLLAVKDIREIAGRLL